MDKESMVEKTAAYVKGRLEGDSSGHDWWHVLRVTRIATHIADREGADQFIVQMAALLHDLDDWKVAGEERGPREAREWMESLDLERGAIERICGIIGNISFKGARVETKMESVEGKVVQDADRLDAMGAIGIGRAFAYGGKKGRAMHDPAEKPALHGSFEEYRAGKGSTINHFHEKLLLLRDRMNTETGKEMAKERHSFLELFLSRFMQEWD
ncbi:MAG: HD domain-containing protein [Candidatus Micrarchaeota archaeon]